MWCSCAIEYFSATKRNAVSVYAITCMDFDNIRLHIMPGERRQTQKFTYWLPWDGVEEFVGKWRVTNRN